MRLEHANICVTDVQASTDFYCRLFGLEVSWEGLTDAGRRAVHVRRGDTYLSLFEAGTAGRASLGYHAAGYNHVGFEVHDLDDYRQRLQAMEVPLKGEEDYAPGRRLYFYDPDGIEIELVEY